MADPTIAESLRRFDSCTISDALDKLGLPGVVIGLIPFGPQGCRIAGRVMTVKLGPADPSLPKRHLGAGAIMAAEAGDVIVVQHGRDDVSGWGGLLSRGALAKGIAAVVADGAVRDVDEYRELGLPVFARAAVPLTARGRIAEHDFNCPIKIGGVDVAPGDWIHADGSGVVLIPASQLEAVIATAEDIAAREQRMIEAIAKGTPLGDVLGANYEDMLKEKDAPNG